MKAYSEWTYEQKEEFAQYMYNYPMASSDSIAEKVLDIAMRDNGEIEKVIDGAVESLDDIIEDLR